MDAEVQKVIDRLLDLSERLKTWAQTGAALLLECQEVGVDLRQSDADTLKTRFFEQLPVIVERKAGALMPPVTANATISLDAVQVKT
jgi:hypothetical protein